MAGPSGKQLREMRTNLGLTQQQMAQRLGLSQAAVSKIETGSRLPGRATLQAWAEVCGKTIEISDAPEIGEGERALLDAAAELDPDDMFLLAEAIRGLAVVKGSDRAHARETLQWLADRAPEVDSAPPVATKPTARVRK